MTFLFGMENTVLNAPKIQYIKNKLLNALAVLKVSD